MQSLWQSLLKCILLGKAHFSNSQGANEDTSGAHLTFSNNRGLKRQAGSNSTHGPFQVPIVLQRFTFYRTQNPWGGVERFKERCTAHLLLADTTGANALVPCCISSYFSLQICYENWQIQISKCVKQVGWLGQLTTPCWSSRSRWLSSLWVLG